MPLTNIQIANPYAVGDISEGWAYCSKSYFDWDSKTLRLRYDVYVSKADADAGRVAIKTVEYFVAATEFVPLLGANASTYTSLANVLDTLVSTKPEFNGSQVEPALVAPPAE